MDETVLKLLERVAVLETEDRGKEVRIARLEKVVLAVLIALASLSTNLILKSGGLL